MEFKGIVEQVFVRTFTKKDGGEGSSSEILVKETDGQYPQSGVFELKNGLDAPKEGDLVTVQFNMSASEWNGKVYGKNRAWKVQVEASGHVEEKDPLAPPATIAADMTRKAAESATPSGASAPSVGGSDDLPF